MKKALIIFVFLILPSLAFAGGGFFFNSQGSQFSFDPNLVTPSLNTGYRMVGGFGYGVHGSGWVSGGFGAAIMNEEDSDVSMVGGMGGSIGGYRLMRFPVHLAFMTYTALGGMRVSGTAADGSYFIASFEADMELGLPISPWFMPVVFAGYRATGNIAPGDPFETFVSYGPVTGIRFTFGGE